MTVIHNMCTEAVIMFFEVICKFAFKIGVLLEFILIATCSSVL